jgi:hypothetical protein
MTDSGVTQHPFEVITDVQSRETDNLALLFGRNQTNAYQAIGLKISRVNRRIERITNLPTLGPGEELDLGFLGEQGHEQDVATPGDDKLRIDDDFDEMLVEYGIGFRPSGVLVAVESPSDSLISGIVGDRTRGYDATGGGKSNLEDFASVRSEHTVTEEGIPTTALSPTPNQGLFRIDTENDGTNPMRFGFKSHREDDAPLEALAYGATYRVTPITDRQAVEDMVYGNQMRRRVVTYGGIENERPNIPPEWEESVVILGSEDDRRAV